MGVVTWIAKLASAYVIAQITVGVQLGVGIAWGVLHSELPVVVLTGALMPLGLLLLAVQYPLAVRMLHSRADHEQSSVAG